MVVLPDDLAVFAAAIQSEFFKPCGAAFEHLQPAGAQTCPHFVDIRLHAAFVGKCKVQSEFLVNREKLLAIIPIDIPSVAHAWNPYTASLDGFGMYGRFGLSALVAVIDVNDVAFTIACAPHGSSPIPAGI